MVVAANSIAANTALPLAGAAAAASHRQSRNSRGGRSAARGGIGGDGGAEEGFTCNNPDPLICHPRASDDQPIYGYAGDFQPVFTKF